MKFLAAAIVLLVAALTASTAHAGGTEAPDPVTDLTFDLITRTASWSLLPDGDASDDAEGFRLTYTVTGRRTNVVTYEADADARSFTLPEDAPKFLCRREASIEVVAFNAAGDSTPTKVDVPSFCPPTDGPSSLHLMLPDLALPSGDASVYTISWQPVEGAHAYLLGGELTAVRESVTGCTDPSTSNSQQIVLDVEVLAPTTTYDIALPALPPDERWRVMPLSTVTFSVLDKWGEPFGGIGQTLIREGCGFGRAQVQLPNAGTSGSPRSQPPAITLAVAVLGLVVTCAGAASRYTSSTLRSAAADTPSPRAADSRSMSLRS